MSFLAFGINHKTATVDVREKVAFDLQRLDIALESIKKLPNVNEAVILSTCNRTEIYCAGNHAIDVAMLQTWLADYHCVNSEDLENCSFVYDGKDVVVHLMRVAAGLDSLVLGEPQILGQLKSAYASAQEYQAVQGKLGRLFEHCFSVAKKVRTDTAIGENPVSVAAAAVNMARQLFSDFSDNTALLIGAGKTTELVARHLKQSGIKKIIIANRTLARAQDLSSLVEGEAALLGDIPDLLIDADIVIASTASSLPILGKGAVERALKHRKHRPFFMVDIAVPRDIEPQVGELSDVYLYTVDDLKDVIDENVKNREGAAQEAERMILEGSEYFLNRQRVSSVGDSLKRFRSHAETLQQKELERALNALRGGADAEQVITQLSRGLTNKLIHHPTISVRRAAEDGKNEKADWLLDLFGIESLSD
ncbi:MULTISPECIES: glutamyl-tRNA reductase [unclassified Oleiphilus]|uniref:glutamyl-tRNA reductase n=1 Tax=unclassified Oleiphilus TaxID=2631174 RepID=UPI0007C28F3F|nr:MULTISPECIES: glutamyl-tRNA reductase [unclassified Oleiphilus]KZY41245.1 glutamyl-tRNA reductase [Oleiphilus sp. HI0050]KZY75296.1 glutamyl-tRNA reductase [Oleiphilus sp. HI0069]KZY78157.1 glutamyl-tRNA reductase [Oleiphilus sp. HI0068]KZY89415.1 glutamyl-tRNA reductase [Oleiphilus sp. HI0072]KZZ07133.1 glutamyl-tRNA reductase [Oleiphilus sp. HI0078]